jgi:hypothetical protein
MKKLSIVSLAFVLALALGFTNSYAQSSAKATARCTGISVARTANVNTDADGWSPVFTTTIKTSEQKDLFVDVSLECGLTTDTKVISKQLERALATAEASIMVKVLVDGNEADPGEVTFAKRAQTLIAEFAGDISGALSIVDGALVIDETLIEPETLQLILDTMSANSFNFIAPDVSVGEHTVEVLAKVSYDTVTEGIDDYSSAEAAATAYIGKGSVTVESVRMVKGDEVTSI